MGFVAEAMTVGVEREVGIGVAVASAMDVGAGVLLALGLHAVRRKNAIRKKNLRGMSCLLV
jgi:hypothetical protein